MRNFILLIPIIILSNNCLAGGWIDQGIECNEKLETKINTIQNLLPKELIDNFQNYESMECYSQIVSGLNFKNIYKNKENNNYIGFILYVPLDRKNYKISNFIQSKTLDKVKSFLEV